VNADDIISILDLKPHPEGGFYRETFRDCEGTGGRAHSTAIYYLLRVGEQIALASHRRDRNLALVCRRCAGADDFRTASLRRELLGPHLQQGQRPQALVPAHHWQGARSLGAYTLVGCTVAPVFEFSKFEVAPIGWTPG
jgi:predicted cupin superfamily sugar epimerase